jgi:hypothetical protein
MTPVRAAFLFQAHSCLPSAGIANQDFSKSLITNTGFPQLGETDWPVILNLEELRPIRSSRSAAPFVYWGLP